MPLLSNDWIKEREWIDITVKYVLLIFVWLHRVTIYIKHENNIIIQYIRFRWRNLCFLSIPLKLCYICVTIWCMDRCIYYGSELMCCGSICSSCSTSVPSRVIHTNITTISLILWQVMKRGEKDDIVTKKNVYIWGIYAWKYVTLTWLPCY